MSGTVRPAGALPDVALPDGARPDGAPPDAARPDRAQSARERAAQRWRSQPAAVPLAIQEAITARHVLRLDYRDRTDRVTEREVEPVAFAATRTQWYLMGWCRLRDAGRAFRLDRILAATDTGEPAPPRSYADLHVDIPDALVRRPDLGG